MRATKAIVATGLMACAGLVLAACSSGDEVPAASSTLLPSASASAAMPSDSASATAAASGTPTGAAALACAAYFDLDLLNSTYAGGAVKDGDMTEEQVRTDFETDLKDMSAQAKAAVADGSADKKMVKNAKRMKKMVKSLDKGAPLSSLSKKQQIKFAKSSLRVQKACDAAGFPLPADNISARKAAGL
jgi:hypothetical protein